MDEKGYEQLYEVMYKLLFKYIGRDLSDAFGNTIDKYKIYAVLKSEIEEELQKLEKGE